MPLRMQHEIAVAPKFPRHSLEKVLRIPKAILDQNAGKDCSDEDTATFLGIKYNKGPYAQRIRGQTKAGNQRAADVWDSIVGSKVQ